VKNIQYDTAKVFDLLYDYLPDIVDTYTTNKGICYDYAALLAAMLRSIGIPAKLVKGYASYAPDTYHAWNEVFIEGEWITVDPTRDATLRASGMAYDLRKEDADYTIVYEY
jgi:transglutaminase-like putative cysteine protease